MGSEVFHRIIGGERIYKWTLTTANPTGEATSIFHFGDLTLQAFGTFGAGTVALDLSLEADLETPSNFLPATNNAGTVIGLTANGGSEVLQKAYWARPKITGSAGASVTVYLLIG